MHSCDNKSTCIVCMSEMLNLYLVGASLALEPESHIPKASLYQCYKLKARDWIWTNLSI